MKARYDYGLVIFILTFCLISVSGYRDDEVIAMAHKRLSAVFIGGATAILVCILIFPAWAGDDLHKQLATNMEKLATFLEGTCYKTQNVRYVYGSCFCLYDFIKL